MCDIMIMYYLSVGKNFANFFFSFFLTTGEYRTDCLCLLIMAPKHPKKPNHVMTLKEKLYVLNDLDSGTYVANVGLQHRVNESTIHSGVCGAK